MALYELDRDEGIVLQSTNAERYGAAYDDFENEELHELVLTNKHVIYVILKSTGFFKEEESAIKVPLSEIKVINGEVQARQVKHDDYGLCLQVQFVHGVEYWELDKKAIPEWIAALNKVLAPHNEPAVEKRAEPTPEPEMKEEKVEPTRVDKKPEKKSAFADAFAGSSAVFAGLKGAFDSAKQTVTEAVQSATESFAAAPVATEVQTEPVDKDSDKGEKKYIYCSNCGEKLNANSKFCNACGTPTNNVTTKQNEPAEEQIPPVIPAQEPKVEPITERKTVYEGELHKCPNCGEVLQAFVINCPACGYELRGARNSSSVREFAAKLEAIEATRQATRSNPFKMLYFGKTITKTDEQKMSLIRSFAIPNTKEDLYEFLILAHSNIDVDAYVNNQQHDARIALSDAWKAKFEQAYQKAKLVFAGDPRFDEIQKLYDSTSKAVKSAKGRIWKILGIVYGALIVLIAAILIIVFSVNSNTEKKEITRLEGIVEEIQIALASNDYRLALMHADSLDYNGSDAGTERDWQIKRDYWIDKVIEDAAEDGVTLDRPADKPDEVEMPEDTKDSAEQDTTKEDESAGSNNTPQLSGGETTTSQVVDAFTGDKIDLTVATNAYLSVKDFGYYYSGKYLHTLIIISNSSDKYAITCPTYRVTAYDKNGKVLGTEEQVLSVIYPQQDYACSALFFDTTERPYRLDVTLLKPEDYFVETVSQLDHPEHKQMVGTNIFVDGDTVTGEIHNPNNYDVESAMVTVIFRNSKGEAIFGEETFIDDIPANGKTPFEVNVNTDEELPSDIEVFAYLW